MHKWTGQDRFGNTIYLTKNDGILSSRPELAPYFAMFLETLQTGQRKQDPLISNKYRYFKKFDALLPDNNYLVIIVIFKMQLDTQGDYVPNNFVTTGWANFIQPKR